MLVGEKIKSLRTKAGITLEQLSKKLDLSIGYLSRLENSGEVPPYRTLNKISEAFNIPITYFIEPKDDLKVKFIKKNERVSVVTEDKETKLEVLTKFITEKPLLGATSVTLAPGKGFEKPHAHAGEELIYLVQGKLLVGFSNKTYNLEPGDSIYFIGFQDHWVKNETNEISEFLVITTPPTFRLPSKI